MSTLSSTLANLIQHALLNPDQPAKTKLKSGLVICLTHPREASYFTLELHRASVYPSATEWYTVLDHFPFPASASPMPKRSPTMMAGAKNTGSYMLRAAIPIQDNLL